MLREAISAATPSVEELARELGVSSSLLRKYRSGDRNPPPEFRLRLAAVLQHRMAVLGQLARRLGGTK